MSKIITCAFLSLFLSGCNWLGIRGNGNIQTDQRPLTDFSELYADGSFAIEWRSGPPSLTITTDANLFPYIETSVSGATCVCTSVNASPRLTASRSCLQFHRSGSKLRGASKLTARPSGSGYAVKPPAPR
jgi:hypothetical protein